MKHRLESLFSLTGRGAVITGGGGLLGTVYAAALATAGAAVTALDLNADAAGFYAALSDQFGLSDDELNRIQLIRCDITDEAQVAGAVKEAEDTFGNLRILVNNASLVKQVGAEDLRGAYKPFLRMDKADWEAYFAVDLTGTLLMSQKAIPIIAANGGGAIVNISSTYGILSPDQRLYAHFNEALSQSDVAAGVRIEKPIGYSVSKSGILNLTRHLATQFAADNIRVNTLTPGGVFADNPAPFVDAYAMRTPLGRMADRMDYVGPLLFLVSDASAYMTGANLIVDGGWSAW